MRQENPRAFGPSDLSRRTPKRFDIAPDAAALAALAAELGALSFAKVRFAGTLAPEGRTDWRLEATLGATVVQPCVATLRPVTTRIDEPVTRRYLLDFAEPREGEAEMDADDTREPLPVTIDPDAVLRESLTLALPLYPRAPGAEASHAVGPDGPEDPAAALRPFAGLAALMDRKPPDDGAA